MFHEKSCHLPRVCSRPLVVGEQTWTVAYYQQDQKLITNDELLRAKVAHFLLSKALPSFRQQIHLQTVPFLVGVDYQKKEVSFLSPRAHRELFLLNNLKISELSTSDEAYYKKLQDHTKGVLSLGPSSFPSTLEKLTATEGLPDLSHEKWASLREGSGRIRRQLIPRVDGHRQGFFERCSDYVLRLTARYDLIRVHQLKFVAILSSLDFDQSGSEVKRLLAESLRRLIQDDHQAHEKKLQGTQRGLPFGLLCFFKLAKLLVSFLPAKPLSLGVRFLVKQMAKRFIAGESVEEARGELVALLASGRDATLDQLGELAVCAKEADRYQDNILKLIRSLGEFTPRGEKNKARINRAHISIKVSALCHDFNPHAFDYTYGQVAPRLGRILEIAQEHGVFINIDAEHYRYRDRVFEIYQKILLERKSLHRYQQTGIVVQAYLRDAYRHLQEVIELAKKRNLTMPIRLVKGAYWDAETVEAQAHSYDAPEFINKEETDTHYRQLIIVILNHFPHVQLCVGGHNLDDHCYSEAVREKYFPQTPPIEHQCLHMTYEGLSVGMARLGWVVRNYVPLGPLLEGMSYLVRRIMENSSQVGVLAQVRSRGDSFRRDREESNQGQGAFRHHDPSVLCLSESFFNIPPVRLYLKEEREAFEKSSLEFQEQRGKRYPNRCHYRGEDVTIWSSSDLECAVGHLAFAHEEDTKTAISRSQGAFAHSPWAALPPAHRASYLLAVGQELLLHRLELAQLIGLEAGKTPLEALGDVDEAIDFLHFYARSATQKMGLFCGLKPRGPVAVISPWNFPLAIPCGMAAAALACGNTVVLKSAEQTPLIAQRLVDVFEQVGLPPDVLIHLPGRGETVGALLVESPAMAQVVFTGSQKVGLEIARKCAGRIYKNPREGTSYPVRVVTEMGGKNAIIVTANAELDETVSGILYSAYGHAGQKCSACSRVIVDRRVASRFLSRFSEASRELPVGEAYAPETWINPLIGPGEKQRLLSLSREIVGEAKRFSGKVHVNLSSEAESLPGNCVSPLVVELPASRCFDRDSFLQRELFAPVVHVVSYESLPEAIDIFNSTPYALTGGLYSQSQDDADYLMKRMECGNIYINRPNTGARVGAEPFGGFKLSGTGPKAGSSDYIDAFLVETPLPMAHTIAISDLQDFSGPLEGALEGPLDGPLPLASPSEQTLQQRVFCLQWGLETYLAQLENLYEGVRPQEQEVVSDFYQWMGKGPWDTIGVKSPNLSLPGQLNYSEFSHIKEYVVLVAKKETFHPRVFLYLMGALCAGSGVTIVSDSPSLFSFWSKVVSLLLEGGFPRKSLRCHLLSFRKLKDFLGHPQVAVYIMDTDLEDLSELAQHLYGQKHPPHHVKKLYHPCEGPPLGDFGAYVQSFVQVRAFAINTMRYGAPLELNF